MQQALRTNKQALKRHRMRQQKRKDRLSEDETGKENKYINNSCACSDSFGKAFLLVSTHFKSAADVSKYLARARALLSSCLTSALVCWCLSSSKAFSLTALSSSDLTPSNWQLISAAKSRQLLACCSMAATYPSLLKDLHNSSRMSAAMRQLKSVLE